MTGHTPNDPQPPDDSADRGAHRMPRWVKGFIVAAVVVVAVIVVVLLAGGDHGPSRHLPGGDSIDVRTPGGHTPPVDHG